MNRIWVTSKAVSGVHEFGGETAATRHRVRSALLHTPRRPQKIWDDGTALSPNYRGLETTVTPTATFPVSAGAGI